MRVLVLSSKHFDIRILVPMFNLEYIYIYIFISICEVDWLINDGRVNISNMVDVFPGRSKRGNPAMTTNTLTARRKADPQDVLREMAQQMYVRLSL